MTAAINNAGAQGRSTSVANTRDCYLKVDGIVQVDNPCRVYSMPDGGNTVNIWDGGKPAKSHFAVVSAHPDGTADVTWNADPDDDRQPTHWAE